MWVVLMKNLPNLLCHCQRAYFAVAIDTCFELLVPSGAANQGNFKLVFRKTLFGVSPTISKLKANFHITGDVRDKPRSERPKKTTPEEDRFLTLSVLRYRRLFSTDLQSRFAGRYGRRLSAQTIQNRLHTANLQSHRAARRPAMTALHHQTRLRWCRQHVHWNLNMWKNVMFSDESRFCLRQLDRRVKVWRSGTELYPPRRQHSPPQSRVYQRLPPEFGSGEDGMACQQS
ncbi:hypothetical protein MHYP_G00215390 [Metynnis hypsauchen]